MRYKEYGLNYCTYVVHHTTGTGAQGDTPIEEKEIVFTAEDIESCQKYGEEHYPHPTNWENDRYTININISTEQGKKLHEEFNVKFNQLEENIKQNPDDYKTYNIGELTVHVRKNPLFDD